METTEAIPGDAPLSFMKQMAFRNVIDNQATQAIYRYFPLHKQLNTISRGGRAKSDMDAFIDEVVAYSRDLKRQIAEATEDSVGKVPVYTGWPEFRTSEPETLKPDPRDEENAAPPAPEPVVHTVSAPADKALIEELRSKLAESEEQKGSLADELGRVSEALTASKDALDNGRPETAGGGYQEYGPPAEVITEVEPEPADTRPRLIASDWLKGQMKPDESLGTARNRLLTEYNILLNKNVTASFANDDERIRFRDLTANMTDFSKG